MTNIRVVYAPEAEAQLDGLHHYIAVASSAQVATDYVDAILVKCESLADFPQRGTPRHDLRPGLRSMPFRRRVTIVYDVEPALVTIIGIFYAGQDFEAGLREE